MAVSVAVQVSTGAKDRREGKEPQVPDNALYMSGWLNEDVKVKRAEKQHRLEHKAIPNPNILRSIKEVHAVVVKLQSMGYKGVKVEDNLVFARGKFHKEGWVVFAAEKPWHTIILPSYLKELLTTRAKKQK